MDGFPMEFLNFQWKLFTRVQPVIKKLTITFISLLSVYQLCAEHPGYETKILQVNGQEIVVTHHVDSIFIGRYSGSKSGYLFLNIDGTGIYQHDESGIMKKNCPSGAIDFEWGFLLNDEGELVSFERPYGLSYPVIYVVTGNKQFQGCSKSYLVDYIMVKKNGVIAISSSSDWVKE